MQRLRIHHRTVYRYRRPVSFGPHRWLFRPRDKPGLRIVSLDAEARPEARLRWCRDAFDNAIALVRFDCAARELALESAVVVELDDAADADLELADGADSAWAADERADLESLIARGWPDPSGEIAGWAQAFMRSSPDRPTLSALRAMNEAIGADFRYRERDEPGVQSPRETLEFGSGSCRDYAVFLMEAARSLGVAARFVTGYLHDPDPDGGGGARTCRAGSTHAWAELYLPGAGWVGFDPTNGIVGGSRLIGVGAARTPEQAVPLRGTFEGGPEDSLGMTVEVAVSALP